MLNIFNTKKDKSKRRIKTNAETTPSINQGQTFHKYQDKITKRLEKNAEILSGKEGFTTNGLTSQTKNVINNNDYSSQQNTIQDLRTEYSNTLNEYEDLAKKLSGDVSGYIDRVNPNNPYLNKTVKFSTSEIAYVTNQGILKLIPSIEIWDSLNISKKPIELNIPWKSDYSIAGNQIPTTPPLVSGTAVVKGQTLGNEGSNVYVNAFLSEDVNASYMGCYAVGQNNDTMSFLGDKPPSTDVSIKNGNFNQPIISNNSHQYITSSSQVPGWEFASAALLNNSKAWGYPTPYPNGNQCVSLQNMGSINTLLNLNVGVKYKLAFYACGRNCCSGGRTNPIKVQLYTTNNAFISTVYEITPPIQKWTSYSVTFSVPTSQMYKLYFSGSTNTKDQSSAIQNISMSGETSSSGSYTYDDCKNAAIQQGYQYFALQNVNDSTSSGYCAVSNSSPSVTRYGEATTASKLVALWSSNTEGQPGNTAVLSTNGSLQVLNASGQSVFSSPATNANPSNYLGCYQDCSKGRGLPNYLGNNNTYKTCQTLSQQGKWSYFGLQNTQPDGTSECWVGNDLEKAKSMGKASNCSVKNGVNVGGGCSNAVYNNLSGTSDYYLLMQDDGNMCVNRGSNPNDNQGQIWATQTAGKQRVANPDMVASKGKYGKNWMPSGGTLSPGDFVGSNDGKTALIMQTDGNLVLYTYEMSSTCQKMSDGRIGGGLLTNAAYDIGKVAEPSNLGKLAYVGSNSELYEYPSDKQMYSKNYVAIKNRNTGGNDISGANFANATVEQCKSSCNNITQCAGFVFDNTNKICYPKNSNMYPYSETNVTTFNGLDIYVRDKIPSDPPLGVSKKTHNIDTTQYGAYINAGKIGDKYGLPNANTVDKQRLDQLQTKLDLLSKNINSLTEKFGGGTIIANKQGHENVSGIHKYVSDIGAAGKQIQTVSTQSNGGLQNILKDSDIVVLQKNYEYLFWTILATGTVLISMNVVQQK